MLCIASPSAVIVGLGVHIEVYPIIDGSAAGLPCLPGASLRAGCTSWTRPGRRGFWCRAGRALPGVSQLPRELFSLDCGCEALAPPWTHSPRCAGFLAPRCDWVPTLLPMDNREGILIALLSC